MFALISKITDAVDLSGLGFHFLPEVFCPFNFHIISNVRVSYLQIVNKCLKQGLITTLEPLLRLSLQSLAMERQKQIIKLNLENLRLIVTTYDADILATDIQRLFEEGVLPQLLYAEEISDFGAFKFYESRGMESIEGNYYKLVVKPVSPDEIQQFQQAKQKSMSMAMAIIMERLPAVAVEMQAYLDSPENQITYLMSQYKLVASSGKIVDGCLEMASYFTSEAFGDTNISAAHFKELPRLQTVMQ